MTVEIDTESGFCFGVTSAIQKAEEELQHGQLFCLGDIVHNGQEVERLAQLGLETIDYDDLRTLRGVRVLLRAHGEPPSTYRIAKENGIEIIDASCPVVKKLQDRIREAYHKQQNTQIVLFGKAGHAEVIGLQGQTNNTAIVVESTEDLEKINWEKDICLFSQTTKSVEEFNAIVQEIQSRAKGKFEWHDTICRNVANRVEKIRKFAQQHDLVYFVGGKKSSNAKVLYEHCKQANRGTIFVSSPEEINRDDWQTVVPKGEDLRIGICGATSTPLWLMEACKQRIETMHD